MAKKLKAVLDAEQAEIDRLEAELAADEADSGEEEAAAEEHTALPSPADPVAMLPIPDAPPAPEHKGEMIHLESGGQVEVRHDQFRLFRVQGLQGEYYEHVRDTPDGEWVYRPIS